MGIKKYIANKDNTITNAFRSNLTTRATGSNMGASDILETFSIYGQTYSSSSAGVARSQELSRVLIQFPTADIEADRTAGSIPASGSVEFYLKVFNAKHSYTVPKNLKLIVAPVSSSWEEGFNSWVTNVATSIDKDLLDIVNPKIEKIIVKAALEKSNGKKNEAAILLGLGRNTLAKKMKELGI